NDDIGDGAAIAGSKIDPDFVGHNIITAGTLTAGSSTITGTLAISGQTTINSGATSTTLPIDRGAANQVLTTDGSGTASWTTPVAAITGTTGSIFFAGDAGAGIGPPTENNSNLFWDNVAFSGNGALGIGTTTPTSTLHTGGSFSTNIRNQDIGIVTVLENDHTIIISGPIIQIDLPPADASSLGRIYIIKNITGNPLLPISDYRDSDGVITPG